MPNRRVSGSSNGYRPPRPAPQRAARVRLMPVRRSYPARRSYARRRGNTPRAYRLLMSALMLMILLLGGVLIVRLFSYRAAQQEYAAYREVAQEVATPGGVEPSDVALTGAVPEPDAAQTAAPASVAVVAQPVPAPSKPAFYSGKVAVLMEDNREAVGWIDIPGTPIQYPVVQARDNDYYMQHTFAKKRNDSGAIFLDSACSPDLNAFNTIIYGHNMNDGTMFHALHNYRDQAYADARNFVEITLLRSKRRYRIFAAYISQGEGDFDFRAFDSTSEEQRRTFIRALRKRSEIDIPATVRVDDQLLTLVTCTSGSHPWYWVVHAVLVEEQVTQG